MAIEQSNMDTMFQLDDDIRNAPTPPLDIKSELDLNFFDDNNNFGLLQQNQTIVFQQPATSSYNHAFAEQFSAIPNSSLMPANNSFQYVAAYSPSATHFFPDTEPISGRESVVSKMSSRKEKCMTRNAIAARENREKKKNEVNTLRGRVSTLEQENAIIKKKYNEVKEAYKQMQEQQKYYDNVLHNLPSVMNILEHMKSLPNNEESAKKFKKKMSNINFVNNSNLGVCFHLKTNQEMSLRFCETCNNGPSSKKKNVET